MLDIHQLHIFLVAAESLNFTQAAQHLHLTQPSVSQHIQSLERHFKTPLFIRNGRNIELTDAGLSLIPLAREAVNLSIRIEETLETLKGDIYGHLQVGCSTTPGKYILPQLLARFHRRYPQVRVTCQVTSQTEAMEMLSDGQIHFALASLTGESHPDLDFHSFICDNVILIAPINHPWEVQGEIDPSQLLQSDFIMREETSGTFISVREALATIDTVIDDLQTLLTLGNAEAIVLAVQEGIGVGFVSEMVVDRLGKDRVATIKVKGLSICREIYIAQNARRPVTAAQKAFWEFIQNEQLGIQHEFSLINS
jgi:DNA-binding transcriptional LysR family regulator